MIKVNFLLPSRLFKTNKQNLKNFLKLRACRRSFPFSLSLSRVPNTRRNNRGKKITAKYNKRMKREENVKDHSHTKKEKASPSPRVDIGLAHNYAAWVGVETWGILSVHIRSITSLPSAKDVLLPLTFRGESSSAVLTLHVSMCVCVERERDRVSGFHLNSTTPTTPSITFIHTVPLLLRPNKPSKKQTHRTNATDDDDDDDDERERERRYPLEDDGE